MRWYKSLTINITKAIYILLKTAEHNSMNFQCSLFNTIGKYFLIQNDWIFNFYYMAYTGISTMVPVYL